MYQKLLVLSSVTLAMAPSIVTLQNAMQNEKRLVNSSCADNENSIALNSQPDRGVTKVETEWYYFGTYMDVYLSNNVTNQLKNVYEHFDGVKAVEFLIDVMDDLGYGGYAILIATPATGLGLASNLAIRKPWNANVGTGIQWGQGVFGTITNVWNQ